jgi:hypothetical protein
MSYFKPLNSNENNLHLIRISINSNATVTLPTTNQLPTNFSVSPGGGTIANVTLSYPNIFNTSDIPSVFIQTDSSEIVYVSQKNNNNCIITSSSNIIPNIDVFIIGSKVDGPVFAVSNRGWKYSTNLNSENIIYSDMLVGINTDDPAFKLTHNGNIGFIPNTLNTSTSPIISDELLNNYFNIVNIDSGNSTVSLPSPVSDGQLLNVILGNISDTKSVINIDMTSQNINTSSTSNILLQSKGDSVSFYSYNNQWLLFNKLINSSYNDVNLGISYNPNILLNGKLNILNVSANANINLPQSSLYNGNYLEMVVGSVNNNSTANLFLGNISSSKNSLIMSNVGDYVKFIAYNNQWLLMQSQFN